MKSLPTKVMDQIGDLLTGEWIGFYPGHFDQVVKVELKDNTLVATKITGDDYIPEGMVTWTFDLTKLNGQGVIACEGYTDVKVPGMLLVLGVDRMKFIWQGYGEVTYRRDEPLSLDRKIEMEILYMRELPKLYGENETKN